MECSPIYFDAERVRSVLTWPLLNEAVEEAFKAVAHTESNANISVNTSITSSICQPQRSLTTCGDSSKILLTMPAYVRNYQLSDGERNSTLACKLVTSFPTNERKQPALPNIMGNILLFNTDSGRLECIMDGTQITAWRTAAASIVATKYLYFSRFPESDQRSINIAIIGCGVQGQSHALGMCATFQVANIYLWNRTSTKADALLQTLRIAEPKTKVHIVQNVADAVANVDVICVGTFASTALISLSMLPLNRVVHINTVGAGQVHFSEVAQDIYDVAQVYVDSWQNAKSELKDLRANIVATVGEIIEKNTDSNLTSGITIFQSVGMASEDAIVAQAVYEALKRE